MEPLRTLVNSGYASARRGEYRAAAEDFRTVLAHDPNHVGALYGLAACLHRLSHDEAASEHLHRILRIQPGHSQAKRLLNEIQDRALESKGYGGPVEDPINADRGALDPFGTGLVGRAREIDVIPEWRTPGRDAPSMREIFLEGRETTSGSFGIVRCYASASRFQIEHFGSLVLGSWLTLFVLAGLVSPFAKPLIGWIERGAPLSPLRIALILLALPLLGIFSCYCHRLRIEGEKSLLGLLAFPRYYPNLLFCLGWTLVPALLAAPAAFGVSMLIDPFIAFPLADAVYSNLFPVCAVGTVYLWWRCWFLDQVVYSLPDLHPLAQLGRAYYATSGGQIQLAVFTILQVLFLLAGLATFGLLLGVSHAAQTEAYLQIQESSKRQEGSAGGFRS